MSAADQRGGVARPGQPSPGSSPCDAPLADVPFRDAPLRDELLACRCAPRSRRHRAAESRTPARAVRLLGLGQAARAGRRRGGHDRRATASGGPAGAAILCGSPCRQAGQLLADAGQAQLPGRRCACAVSITSLRRLPDIRLRPITARSSRHGWISTTSVPPARTRLASWPSRRPEAARLRPRTRSSGCSARVPAPPPRAWRWGSGRSRGRDPGRPAGRGSRPSARRRPRSGGRRSSTGR